MTALRKEATLTTARVTDLHDGLGTELFPSGSAPSFEGENTGLFPSGSAPEMKGELSTGALTGLFPSGS